MEAHVIAHSLPTFFYILLRLHNTWQNGNQTRMSLMQCEDLPYPAWNRLRNLSAYFQPRCKAKNFSKLKWTTEVNLGNEPFWFVGLDHYTKHLDQTSSNTMNSGGIPTVPILLLCYSEFVTNLVYLVIFLKVLIFCLVYR